MKKFLAVFTLLLIMSIGILALAQSGSPSPAPSVSAVVSAPPAPSFSFIKFVVDNKGALGLLVYAILDVLVLAIPKLDGYGIIHQILIASGKMATPPSTDAPKA